jgi:hypothetical protein
MTTPNRVEMTMNFIFGIALVAGFGWLYFPPSIVAAKHRKRNKGTIFLLNVFLGWTFVGWVIAMMRAKTNILQDAQPGDTV